MDNDTATRAEHFRQNFLAWAALIHFLPANLLREFCFVAVEFLSNTRLSLPELFDELLIATSSDLDYWLIRPKDPLGPLAQYLQRRIRSLTWGNDYYIPVEPTLASESAINPLFLENAIRLGWADLTSPSSLFEPQNFPTDSSSIHALREFHFVVRRPSDSRETKRNDFEQLVRCVDMPLAAIMVKHFGDLHADADQWHEAKRLYEYASSQLKTCRNSAWISLCDALEEIAAQSIATALRYTDGPGAAAAHLRLRVGKTPLKEAPLLISNAAHDSYIASSLASDDMRTPDLRAHLVLPPLSGFSHDLSRALQASIDKDYGDANVYFWQLLRRQIALGCATDIQETKAFYGNSIVEELKKIGSRDHRPTSFLLAVRLLLESGRAGFVQKLSWGDYLVRSYVDHSVLDASIAHADQHASSHEERLGVLIEILKCWADRMAIEQTELAYAVIAFLAKTAQERRSSFHSSKNAGGRSMGLIRELAESRPEFRTGAAAAVSQAIISKLQPGEWWTGTQEALKTAALYAEALPNETVAELAAATLSLLDRLDPSRDLWMIVQPALDFLTSASVKRILANYPELSDRAVTTILKFCIHQQTEHARLLFFLSDFDSVLLRQQTTLPELAEVVSDVRKKAKTIQASNAIDNVQALLSCPAVAGVDGIRDAVESLQWSIDSAVTGRISMAFPFAYAAVQMLSTQFSHIVEALSVRPEDVRAWIGVLFDPIVKVWLRAKENPMMFAQFSLPPATKPSEVVVHNWAFASISLAKLLGREDEILQALNTAAENLQISNSIAMARAVRLAGDDFRDMDPAAIRAENRETFYAVLGQRLVRAKSSTNADAIVEALLEQCLRHGPDGLDAAVLMLASEVNACNSEHSTLLANYERRLERSRELRLSLRPLVNVLNASIKPQQRVTL